MLLMMLAAAVKPAKPAPPRDPVSVITLQQRRSVTLPVGQLTVYIGDISAGQVLLHIGYPTGRAFVPSRSVRAGDVVVYQVNGRDYQLAVVRLVNLLVGEDFAVLVDSPRQLTEPQKIEVLLQGLRGANPRLKRGEKAITVAEVERQLRDDLKKAGDTAKTVEDFINLAAPKSAPAETRLSVQEDGDTFAPLREMLQRQAAAFFAPSKPKQP